VGQHQEGRRAATWQPRPSSAGHSTPRADSEGRRFGRSVLLHPCRNVLDQCKLSHVSRILCSAALQCNSGPPLDGATSHLASSMRPRSDNGSASGTGPSCSYGCRRVSDRPGERARRETPLAELQRRLATLQTPRRRLSRGCSAASRSSERICCGSMAAVRAAGVRPRDSSRPGRALVYPHVRERLRPCPASHTCVSKLLSATGRRTTTPNRRTWFRFEQALAGPARLGLAEGHDQRRLRCRWSRCMHAVGGSRAWVSEIPQLAGEIASPATAIGGRPRP